MNYLLKRDIFLCSTWTLLRIGDLCAVFDFQLMQQCFSVFLRWVQEEVNGFLRPNESEMKLRVK